MHPLASIPSPSRSVWHLGPFPLRAYALCIVVGIVVAVMLSDRRMRARGGSPDDVWEVAKWAVPFGILGGRVWHVITDPELYFTHGRDPVNALRIWDGGLGIPGAIALGALGAWIGCRRRGIRLDSFADIVAPGIVLAQGIGRWGNWFNNELYGRPTDLPWKLQIHCLEITAGKAAACPGSSSDVLGYFQPAFLYESLWDIGLGLLLLWLGHRFVLGRGRLFAVYIAGYGLGRLWIEALRIDPANHLLGLRVNIWTALVMVVGGVAWFVTHAGPVERSVYVAGPVPGASVITDPDQASSSRTAGGARSDGV